MAIVFENQQSSEIQFPITQGVQGPQGLKGDTGAQGSGVKITPWSAGAYLSGDQVNHLGKDWVSNAPTVADDVPGTSSKWVDRHTSKVNVSDVVDNLTSSEITKPGSANNDRLLNEKKPDKSDLDLVKTVNLFDISKATNGFYISQLDGSLVSNAAWLYSDYIPVVAGTSYINLGYYAFYDITKTCISGGLDSPVVGVAAPVGASYLRVSLPISDTIQVQEGTVQTTYEPFGYVIDKSRVKGLVDFVPTVVVNEITVKASGTIGVDCDFTALELALDSITDASQYNRYVVNVRNGTYDISGSARLYLGIRNWVNIVGQTKSGVLVINRKPDFSSAYATFDTAYYHDAIEFALLKTMTIISYNGKSPVHIDSGYNDLASGGTVEVVDCDLINENTPEMIHYQNGLACGLRDGQRVVAKNVNSNGQLWVHNVAPLNAHSGCAFELYNCRSPHVEIADIYTYANDKFIMQNCKVNFTKFTMADVFSQSLGYEKFSFQCELNGNEIGYIIGFLDGTSDDNQNFWDEAFGGKFGISDSRIHNFCKNNTLAVIPRNTLVSLDTNVSEVSIKPWTAGKVLYGITLDSFAVSDYGTVQYAGWLLLDADGTTPINVGDEVQLNASGIVEKYTSGYKIGVAMGELLTGTGKIRINKQ